MVSEYDYVAMIEAGLGVGLMPESAPASKRVKRLAIDGLDLNRTLYVYAVAGRQRSAPAAALIKLLRANDWSVYAAA